MIRGESELAEVSHLEPIPNIGGREKRKIMNEFQAILVEVIFFVLRFAIPALIVYASARIVHHYMTKEQETPEQPEIEIIK